MNTKPDDELLALWLEDELEPDERREVEAWIAGREDWIAWKRETREWKQMLRQALPAEQPPPACEFFEARLERIVRESALEDEPVASPQSSSRENTKNSEPKPRTAKAAKFWFPAAAAAGMALCFWAGAHIASPGSPTPPLSPTTVARTPQAPILYTPEQGVKATAFESENAQAMVIVLDGVAAIPDSEEITAGSKHPRKNGTGMVDAQTPPKDRVQ